MLRIANCIIVLYILTIDVRGFDERIQWEERVQWEESKQPHAWRNLKEYNDVEKVYKIEFDDDLYAQKNSARDRNDGQIDRAATVARYIVNNADWAAVATISTRVDIETFPTANVISIADGPPKNGTGIPYMYLTPLDYTARDITKDHRATLLMSLAQGNLCKDFDLDPMSPLCARVMLSGRIKRLGNATQEHKVVKQFFFDRHPKLKDMPLDHRFFFAKLETIAISLLDNFGGPKYIPLKDYFNSSINTNIFDRNKKHYIQHLFSNL